jgi:hypothetical protein
MFQTTNQWCFCKPTYLGGGFKYLEKYEFVNGKDDIPYMKWKKKNVPNHQPVGLPVGILDTLQEVGIYSFGK